MLRALDFAERAFAILLTIPFLYAFAQAIPLHLSFLVVAASETLTVFFILIRRAGFMAATPVAIACAFAGTGLPLLVRPGGQPLAPDLLTSSLMVGGLGLSVLSKLYLNRSFGLIAANRGVKVSGPYRFIRHPMYLGYMVSQLGFLLASFSISNLFIYASAWTVQLYRIGQEEAVLRLDPKYRRLTRRVTARLVPGLY